MATGQTVAKMNRIEYAINSRRRHELEMKIYDATKKISTAPQQAVELRKQINEAQAELKKIAMIGISWQQANEDDSSLIATADQLYVGGVESRHRLCD